MNELLCPVCASTLKEAFVAKVLQKYDGVFSHCSSCGFLCAADPFWLEESYSSAIASTDTGLVARNVALSKRIASVLYFLMGERGTGRYVDVAGGYGMLTRLMRDYGFDFYWADKYCQNELARGFEYIPDMGGCRAVTAIEVMEHAENPIGFIQEALTFAQADTLIFTTELFEGNLPHPDQWRYYSFETGQHIAFFQRRTLKVLAERLGLEISSNGWLHILSRKCMDERLLQMCTGRVAPLAAGWVRRHLASRMMSDHDKLVSQLKYTKS